MAMICLYFVMIENYIVMNHILVPTDFSDCAMAAVQVAADIARKSNAQIRLLHVYERPVYGFVDISVDHEQNRQLKDDLKQKLTTLQESQELNGLDVVTSLSWDRPVWEVISDEEFQNHDLVVMGTHGASGFKEVFIGSNAEKTVRTSRIPVLTVNEKQTSFNPGNIVFASNFYRETESAFSAVQKLAKLFNSKVSLLKINTPGNFEATWYSEKTMSEFANNVGLESYEPYIYNDENVEKGILNFCESKKPDMIAIATHGRTGLLHLINGSIAESVVNHFELPVLSIRLEEIESPTGVIFPY